MKKCQVALVLVAICLVAVSCSQPKAPTGTVTPTEPVAPVQKEAAAVEVVEEVGEVEAAEVTETADETAEPVAEVPAAAESNVASAETAEPVAEVPADAESNVADSAEAAEKAAPAGEPAIEGGTPKLVVPEPIYNFGSMRDTETLTHQFVLRNGGTGLLKITNVRASCGCTTTELEKDELAPGEEIKISAAVNLSGRQGKQVKAVTISSNDPDNQSVQLRMEGMVTASVNVEPDRVNFGEILDDEPREAVVAITSTVEDLTFTVQSAELTNMDYIEHEIKEVEPGKSYQVLIRTVGDLPVGQHNGRMIIRTDAKVRPVIFLNISMQVIGPLQIMPPVIHIRHTDTPGEVSSQQLRISPGRVEEFEIEEVICPVEGMTATLTPQGENIYLLRLENMPSSDILTDKFVVLRTNLEAHKEIQIPFNVAKLRVPPRPNMPRGKMPTKTVQLTPEQKKMMRNRVTPTAATEGEAPDDPAEEAAPAAPAATPAEEAAAAAPEATPAE